MKFRLIPRNETFFPMFVTAAENVEKGAVKLSEMIEDHLSDSTPMMKEIKKIEKRGDGHTREIVQKVQHSFVTPFDREDIHELAEGIDDILDEILNVADVLVLHNVTAEDEHLSQLSQVLVESCGFVTALMQKLTHLNDIDDELEGITRCKRKARKIYRDSVSRLFSGDFGSFEVLKLKDVNESLREAVKQTDHVADIVEAIAVKFT